MILHNYCNANRKPYLDRQPRRMSPNEKPPGFWVFVFPVLTTPQDAVI